MRRMGRAHLRLYFLLSLSFVSPRFFFFVWGVMGRRREGSPTGTDEVFLRQD